MRATQFFLILLVCGLSSGLWLRDDSSCKDRCDDPFNSSKPCQCNSACSGHNDCCSDYQETCNQQQGSCVGRCGNGFDGSFPCQCNEACVAHHDCCSDYSSTCQDNSDVTEQDLIDLSEKLFSFDMDNVGGELSMDLGCKSNVGNSQDCSPNPLFSTVEESINNIPVYRAFAALLDNYDKAVTRKEDHTQQEQQEERDFLQIVMESDIMRTTYEFLSSKGTFVGSFEQFGEKLYSLWFGLYERSSGVLGSSGFEHVFIGEVKNNEVSGFHNWFSWYTQEKAGLINYLGYWKQVNFGNNPQNGGGMEFTYFWEKDQKPYGSFFVGTSPTLELALYTTCFLTMPDKVCHMKLSGTDVYIQTWTLNYKGQIYVGSSYPDFAKP